MRDPHLRTVNVAILCGLLGSAACSEQHSAAAAPERSPATSGGTHSQLAFVPNFPGAGKSGADAPLVGGRICDSKERIGGRLIRPTTTCFFQPGQAQPAATIEQVLECVDGVDAVHLRLTFDPAFVDNSYGANAIGWSDRGGPGGPGLQPGAAPGMMGGKAPPRGAKPPMAGKGGGGKGHTWKDLVGSDHAEFVVTDGAGELAMQFKLDYVSVSDDAPSGYASLGVLGGDGRMIVGDEADIVEWHTSIERNLNERGYAEYIVDSPATDAAYTPNAETPNWDYRVVYEAWIDHGAFDDRGFGGALIEHVHASPSKAPKNTIEVVPGECPPCADAGCSDTPLDCDLDPSLPECQLE